MAAKPTIVVLFHKETKRNLVKKYEIHAMAAYWREKGYPVSYLFGTSRHVPGEVCIVHVDLSVVPNEYLEFASRYPVVLNGRIADIRKSVTSDNLLSPDGTFQGPVIVKTDLNFAGWPERTLAHGSLTLGALKVISRLRMTPGILTHHNYRIFDQVSQIPGRFLNNDRYVIERFLPEVRDGMYCVNYYKFFGTEHECTRRYSNHPVVISSNTVKSVEIDVHPAVVDVRDRVGIDFGKIDYCVHDGTPVILDINKTPGRRTRRTNVPLERLWRRADGLEGFTAPP